jgi:TolA-binding protein
MSHGTLRALSVLSALGLTMAVAAPARAQSREQRQMMADVRILQEQNQVLQNILTSIVDSIKAVNSRIDEQAGVSAKSIADQRLLIDNLTNTVREIREKMDDSAVRLGSLSQEVDAVRQGLQQLSTRPAYDPAAAPAPDPGQGGTGTGTAAPGRSADPSAAAVPPAAPPPAVPIGTSPQKLWDEAYSDYTLAQWDLAIAGFEAVIKYFPTAERASDAQVYIGHSYMQAGKNDLAVEAYDAAIRNYPNAPALPDAYYKKGIALKTLKQADAARAAFEFVVKTYPDSSAASLARQQIPQSPTRN